MCIKVNIDKLKRIWFIPDTLLQTIWWGGPSLLKDHVLPHVLLQLLVSSVFPIPPKIELMLQVLLLVLASALFIYNFYCIFHKQDNKNWPKNLPKIPESFPPNIKKHGKVKSGRDLRKNIGKLDPTIHPSMEWGLQFNEIKLTEYSSLSLGLKWFWYVSHVRPGWTDCHNKLLRVKIFWGILPSFWPDKKMGVLEAS